MLMPTLNQLLRLTIRAPLSPLLPRNDSLQGQKQILSKLLFCRRLSSPPLGLLCNKCGSPPSPFICFLPERGRSLGTHLLEHGWGSAAHCPVHPLARVLASVRETIK